ncbi:MAG TPA: MerR family transcriptional regulator [Pirellulales bacterium]|nr:MerR family transcriptional regulator [Pirellulales bacterium]
MTTTASDCSAEALLKGQRVALVGKLSGMSKREAQQLVRQQGGVVLERPDASATLLVLGEEGLPLADGPTEDAFDEAVRGAVDRGTLEIVRETQLWQRLGLVEREPHVHPLYTPAMLAELLGVAVSLIRRWQRRGWIVPVREVRRLPYFDFQEVATARRLTELLASGMSPSAIEKKLAALQRYLPDIKRPLAQLSIIVEGKQLLLRQGDGLREPGGQLRFDFGAAASRNASGESVGFTSDILVFAGRGAHAWPATPAEMVQWAGQLEDEGQLQAAAEMYRSAMAAGGPTAEICFLLAESLYQMHDLPAARERYYMAVELDEDYVEARANLGCVLAELGEQELAISAFEGALAYHDDYPDVHYHLARILDETERADEALAHWEAFLRLAPMSPWADQARHRLGRR